jgi:hypothetical protein
VSVPQLCPCSLRHSPPITEAECDEHHVVPKSWPLRPGVLVRRKVRLCANAHRRAHTLYNLYVVHGGEPPAHELRKFPLLIRDLAVEAWRDADHSAPLQRTVA